MRALVARAWCSGAVTDTRHRGRSSDARCLALVLVVLLAAVVGVVVAAGAAADPLPPADPAAPWQTRDDALLPYPVFHPAVAVLNNSIVLLGGCVTATCATPVGSPSPADAAHASTPAVRSSVGSPYHVQSLAIHVELGTVKALPRLTLPAEMGFAGRYAAVTLTDSVYVARSCTHTTHSPRDVAAMTPAERSTLQAAYAPILALYPEEAGSPGTALPAVNLSYFDVPADRVRVNASCTALATENKVLIIGGFLLSEQRVTASVDSFDVVTRRYDTDVAMLSAPVMHAAVATSTGVAVVAGGWTYEADASGAAAATSSTPPLHRQVMQRLLDLFFFDADSGVCASPVDVSALPNTVVGDILRSPSGCHVELFGGQVVLANHNLGNIAVLNIRAAPAWASHGVVAQVSSLLRAPPPPASSHATTQRVGNSSRSSISPSPTPDSTSSSTTPTPPPPSPPPPPAYSYTWAGPTLVSLPAARHPNDTATAAGDTVLLYHAFGGQDQWWRTATAAVAGQGDKRSDGDDGDELVRAEPARRWALRAVPDAQHDTDRPELLEVTMPTPVWPDDLTLHTTSDGIIRVVFSDVDYTRYCTWGRSGDEVCAVRLSSRRDCVGTTAGTLDSPYGGAANATVRFSASGSTTPVYVCLGYVVQPIAWSLCRSRLSFTIVNPMMPLGILDSSRTTTRAPPPAPPTPPPPTRDPADKATGSPLFALAVGVAVVTLLVAVLLVARLQHVPEEGLLSADVFERGGGGGGDADGTPSRVPDWRRRRRRLPRATVASGSSDDERAAALPTAMTEEEEEGEDSDGVTGRRSSVDSYEEYCHLVEAVQEERETRMLTAAADVLSLHQSRYRVVSSIGQGEHSLCFLALRRTPPPPQQQQQQQQRRRVDTGTGVGRGARALGRFVASLLRLTPHTHTPTVSSAERSPYMAPGAAVASPSVPASSPRSSLWAARHDESVAVAVKYTQCPDDATRAIITRLCERLRDLHADAVTTTAACRPPPPQQQQQKRQRPPPVQQSCRRASDVSATPADAGGASGAATETGQAAEAVLASERSSGLVTVATSTTTTSRTGTLSMLCAGAEAVAAVNVRDHANDDHNDHNGGDGADSDGDVDASCAVLDTHEVSVVLALFLLLPEDLFVSYEVSVLHHHQQQQHHHQHHHHHRSSGNSSSGGGGGGRRRYMSATQRTASREAVRWNMTHIWAGDGAAPRVCWTACINACHPPAVNPWSLCLAMPYERAGDLASFIRRCQHALQLPAAAAVPDAPRHHHGSDDADDSGGASLGVPPVYAGWRESLLCSMLFQVGAGLQLLHAQSPPILHGNITATNVLLREPAVFSVARRRVVGAAPTVGAVQEGGTPGQARCITAATEASGGAGAPWRARSLVAAAAAWRVGSPLLRSAPPRLPPLPPDTDAEGLLCTHTYLPLTITDAGMSWWLAAQLPQRLRGCFGRTTRSSLQRTADGRQWLRRHDDGGEGFVPAPACIVALSRFLIHFVEVPTHIAPEMLWGRLCAHSVSDGSDGDTAAAAGLSSSTVRRHPSRRRRERRPRCSGAVAQDDGRGVPDSAATRSTSASGASVRAANTRDAAGDWDDDDDDDTGEIFTREEVRALTAAMWRAEGLTRMPRRGGAGRPSRTTTTTTTAVAVRQTPVHADAPDAAAGPRSHTGSPLLAAPAGATSLMSRRRCGGRRRGSAGGGTSVYELLVQRVLAVNTASDMWGLGVLLYSMCTDAVADSRLLGAPALSTETEAAATTAAAAAVSPPPRPSSRLAEQCFAALLGDLFDLAALFSAGDGDAEDIGGISTEARASAVVADADKDDDDDDAHRWPRSRAVEAAVERSFTDAGYSRALASLLAAMLSPVAARRPTAGEVVAQLRLVHPADGAEARHMSGSSSSGGSGVAVGHPWRPPPHRSTDATSAVVLHERTAHMTLRRR
ncbi:hypothetical protein NESM_000254600 [Novymonas esmeraldas]|uniref:non-specific serine/threonine protein kinase n=1 Tax=Novymonas esmeraldas TaxID=1808958 RepID=A0AAW0F5K5_9TRYP